MDTATHLTYLQYSDARGGRIAAIHANSDAQVRTDNIVVYGNRFEEYGAGAVGIGGSRYVSITGNVFYRNHSEFPYEESGGQLAFLKAQNLEGARDVFVVSNWFDGAYVSGPGGQTTTGIEGWGLTKANVQGNESFHHTGQGMSFLGARCLWIDPGTTGYKVESNSWQGIEIGNNPEPGLPQSGYIQSDSTISINNGRYGIEVNSAGVGSINEVRVMGNTLTGNSWGPAYFAGVSNLCTSGNTPSLPTDVTVCGALPPCPY